MIKAAASLRLSTSCGRVQQGTPREGFAAREFWRWTPVKR